MNQNQEPNDTAMSDLRACLVSQHACVLKLRDALLTVENERALLLARLETRVTRLGQGVSA